VRHGGGTAAAGGAGFSEFGDFGLHMQREIASDFGECAGENTVAGGGFGDAFALRMPGDARERERQFFGKKNCNLSSAVAQGGERAGGAPELQDQGLFEESAKTLTMLQASVKPTGGDETESGGQRMLQPGARGQQSFAMCGSELSQSRDNVPEIGLYCAGSVAQLKHEAGIERVLTGGAVVNVSRGVGRSASNDGGQLLQQRNGKVSGGRHGLREGRQIEQVGPARRSNRGGEILGDDSGAGLRAGQGSFKIEDELDSGGIAE